MEFFERASGARMHTALYKPFGFDSTALNSKFLLDIANFIKRSGRALSGAFLGLLNNRALKARYSNVGLLSPTKLQAYGITGILLRSCGIPSDLRFNQLNTWGSYSALSFKTFLGRRGDNLDRFIIRIKETVEAFRIIAQLISLLGPSSSRMISDFSSFSPSTLMQSKNFYQPHNTTSPLTSTSINSGWHELFSPVTKQPLSSSFTEFISVKHKYNFMPTTTTHARGRFTGMEELITHFRLSSEGYPSRSGISFGEVESPKGVVSVILVTNGSSRPVRMKLRSPVAHNLNLIPAISSGSLFADFVATFCSLDVVLGEIDR